jgi:hypothetical protein
VLEKGAPEPSEVVAGLDAVTGEDVSCLAHELISADRFRLAVIGPFDDPARFESLLDN